MWHIGFCFLNLHVFAASTCYSCSWVKVPGTSSYCYQWVTRNHMIPTGHSMHLYLKLEHCIDLHFSEVFSLPTNQIKSFYSHVEIFSWTNNHNFFNAAMFFWSDPTTGNEESLLKTSQTSFVVTFEFVW
jgi:hypothetical protein